jgi:hypothetical protein
MKNYHSSSPEDFLYARKGPWPQPSPAHPIGESAAVIHLPLCEKLDWWLFIGSRYLLTLAYTPIAYIKGIFLKGLVPVSDERTRDLLYTTR